MREEEVKELHFVELVNGERSRTYHFPGGRTVTIKNVAWVTVPEPGHSQRLMCLDGAKWIVMPGYCAIQIDADEWSM